MSVLKLSKNDIYKNGDDDKKIKLTKSQIHYDSAMVSGWETGNKGAYSTLEKYHQRINNGGYLSADDLASYRRALDIYADTSKGLRGIAKVFGQDIGDEQEWSDSILQLKRGYKELSDYYSQWKTEDDYNAWYRKESFIKTYLEDPEKATTTMDYQDDWLNEAKLREKTKQILGAEDFQDYKGYVSTEQDRRGLTKPKYADTTYEIVNRNKEAWSQVATGQAWGKYSDRQLSDLESFEHMTDDEIAIYNYLYAKGGWREGQAYLDSIKETLNYRKGSKRADAILSIDNDLLRTFAIGFQGLSAGFDQFNSGLEQFFSSDKLPTTSTQFASAQISDSLDGFGKHAYNATTTIGNMAPSILVGTLTGGIGGAATMGVSAAGNAYGQALDMGYNKLQARAYSTLVGASEGALQYALGGITKLGGGTGGKVLGKIAQIDNSLLRVSAKLGWETVKEIGEEELQNYLEPAFRSIIFGEDYDAPTIEEIIETAIVTALSTGVLEGGATITKDLNSSRYYTNTYGNVQRDLVDQALEGGEFANPLAQKYQQRLDNGGSLTGHQIGRLVEANEQQFYNEDMASIQSAAESRLAELGETGDISTIAEALTKQAAGEKLSRVLQKALAGSKFAKRVANELNPENIHSGNYSSAWAEQIDTNRINAQEYSRLVEAAQLPQGGLEATGGKNVSEAQNTAQVQQAEPVASSTETTTDIATSDESSVTADGVTRQVSSGQEVTPKRIASISGGKVMIATDSGTVSADDIEFGDTDTDMLWRSATQFQGINVAGANGIIHAYRSGQPVATYLHGAAQEFRNGYYNMESGGEYADKLTPSQREIIYELGQKAAGENTAKAQAKATKAKKVAVSKTEKTTNRQGNVHFDRKGRTFDQKRETALKTMEQLSKVLGVEFYVFESYVNEAGERVYKDTDGNEKHAPNGYYDLTDGSIHIDLNAGTDGKGTMLFTIAHELTHFIKQWSPAKFKVLANFLITQYGKKGVSVEELVETQIAKANKNGRTIDYDAAFEEVVADSMEAMLVSGNVVQMMAELKQRDKTLWQKICEWFKDLVADLKAVADAYKDHKPDSIEGRMIADMQDVIVILESLYTDALTDAAENYQSTKAEKNTSKEGGEAMFSLRGENKDGIEVYETSEEIKRLPYKERQQRFLEIMANEFRGRTAKFIRNGHAYYATFDEKDVNKNIYGDKLSDSKGWKAKINVGADGNIFELVENAQYNGSLPEKGKKIAAHRGVGYWDYFIKNVQIDDTVYDLVANVRKKADGAYVYSIQLNQNKTIEASPPRGSLLRALSGVPNASKQNVAQDADDVKEKFSDRDSHGNELSEEQQEYFKDSKIRDVNGNLKIMHHGSPESFTVFDKKKARSSSYYGKGFYFTDSTSHAQQYGNTYDVYLNITNPIQDGTREITKDQLRKFVESIAENEDYGIENYGYGATVDSVAGSVYGKSDFAMLMDINASSVGNMVEAIELFNEVNGTDYNGIVTTTETVAFYPEQIKRVDNKAPTDDPDIRYSERDGGNDQNADIYSRVFDMQEEVGRLQRSIEAFEKSTEFKAANDKLSEAIRNDSITEGVKAYQQWRESSGYAALVDKRDAMRVELENLIQERDVLTANDSAKAEQEAIVKSGISEADYFRKQAVKEFGYTPYFYDAGYMTPNGKMLNFSGENGRHFGSRGQDHRAIGVIYEDTQGSAAMVRFMNDGNIRIMAETPGLDISSSAEPTKEQYATIRKFAREYGSKERYFAVDISDENGRVVGNYEYDGYVNADRVVNDIKYYFENGTVREQSSVASFLKSERNPELERVNRVLEKENAELKGDVSYLKELLRLQKTVTGGTKFTKTSVEAAAGQLMKYADARGDKTELAKLLSNLYEYIANGEGLTWDGVKEAAQPAVEWLQSHTNTREQTNGYAGDILREIRSSRVSLDASQKEEAAYRFGSYNEFRKKAMGSVIVADQGTIPLDSQWQEWSSLYPNIFDPETTSTDMPAALLNAVDRLRSMREADTYGYDKELFGQDLLRQVYDSYWNVSTIYTVADKAQKDINRLKLEHSKRMSDLRQFHKEKTAQLKAEHREALQKVKREQQERLDRKLQQTREQYHQSKEKNAENRRKAEMRKKIRRTILDLDKLLNKGDKKRNVKEDMKGFASKALELADYIFTDHISNEELIRKGITVRMTPKEAALVKETEDILTRLYDNIGDLTGEEFARLDEKRKRNMEKLRDLLTEQRNEMLKTPVYNLFNDLLTEYASLKNSKQDAVKAAYDPNVESFLRSYIGESNGETDPDRKALLQNMRVSDMTTAELERLYYAYKMVLHSVREANKLHIKGKNESIDQVVTQIVMDFGSRKIPEKKVAIALQKLTNKLGWDYEKLYYALDRIGSEAFTDLIMNVANSENIVMQDIMEAVAFRDEMVGKYDFNNWDINKEIDREFMDNSGKKFKMTLGQLMSLYAYSRREGAWDHIEYGGFVFGEAALTNPKPADSYKLNKAQCEAITNTLTKEQKGYVEDMQKFLSETMGEKGNEVSMMLYGIKMFGEKNYFPIHIAGQFKAQAQESQAKQAAGFGSMSNAGFTHAQNPNAKAPFVLEGFNEVWADHVNEMSRYHGTVPALEDLRRVMNRSSYSDSIAESTSVKVIMENHFGKEAVAYFDNLYREANSGAITDKLEKNSKWLLSKFRKNSVAYSLSVLIQQPASIVRAYALVDKKYFGFKGFGTITAGIAKAVSDKWTKAHTNAYNEMLKYAPGVTMAKEIGGFDTATGGSIRSYLLDTKKSISQKWKTETATGKGKAVLDLVDNNAVANLPNVADKIAWIEIWNACKRETVAKHKDLAPNSEEFMQAVGERFTEVIRATQVYDSIFAKSPMLKSKRTFVQMLVSFMNEPNTVANMAESAVRDATRGDWKGGVKKAAVLIHSIIFTNVLKSIIYAMRDDDEDETYIEKYIESLSGGIMNDFNALNYIPLLRDVVSVAQGYDVERADMAIAADLIDAIEKVYKYVNTETEDMTEEQLIEFDKKRTEANWKLVESMAAFFGIPVKNIRREINGVIDHAKIASANKGQTTMLSAWDKIYDTVIESIPFMKNERTKGDKLYDAIVSGDKAYLDRLKSTYKTDSAYQSAVRNALRENDSRIHDAAQAKVDGNFDVYRKLLRQIQDEGKFDPDDIMSAIKSEESAIRKATKTTN